MNNTYENILKEWREFTKNITNHEILENVRKGWRTAKLPGASASTRAARNKKLKDLRARAKAGDKTQQITPPEGPKPAVAGDTQVVPTQNTNQTAAFGSKDKPVDPNKTAPLDSKPGAVDTNRTTQTNRPVPDPDAPTAQVAPVGPGKTQPMSVPKAPARKFVDSETPLDELLPNPEDFPRDTSWINDFREASRARREAGEAAAADTQIIDALDKLDDRILDPSISRKVAAFIQRDPKKVFSAAAAAMIGVAIMSHKDNNIQDALASQDPDAMQSNIDNLEKFINTIAPKDPEGPEMNFTPDQAKLDPDADVSDKKSDSQAGSEGDTADSIAEKEGLDGQAVEDDMAELRTNALFQANIDSRYKLQNLPNRAVRLFMVSLIRELDKFYKEKAPNSDRKEIIRNMLDLDDQKIKDLQIRSSVISEAIGARKTPLGREPQKYEDRRHDMIDSIESILEIMINGAQEVDPRWEKINKAIEGGMYGKSGPDKLRDNAARQIFNQLKKLIKKAYNDVMDYGPVKKQMKDLEAEGFDDPLGYLEKYDLTSKEK
jgi:hypothetical protein